MGTDDIGGNSGYYLTIPLRAEFWDGSEFVVNDDDSSQRLMVQKFVNKWRHSDGAITTLASLNGSGSVDDGEEEVTANQNTPAGKDACRVSKSCLWLRMGIETAKKTGENDISCSTDYGRFNLWLQYNWRQSAWRLPPSKSHLGIYRGKRSQVLFTEVKAAEQVSNKLLYFDGC